MAINIPIEKETTLFDVMKNLADIKKARVGARFAEPTAQANLDKLKALIEETNLGNQTSRLKMPYVTQREEADIGNKRAHTGYLQAETNLLPKKYELEGGRLGLGKERLALDKEKFNRLQGQVKLNFLKSLPPASRNTFLAATPEQQEEILGQYVVSNLGGAQNAPIAGGVGNNNAPNQNPLQQLMNGPPKVNPTPNPMPQNEMFRKAAEIAANKGLTTSKLQEQRNAYEQLGSILGDPKIVDTLKRASKYAGISGKGKQWFDAVFRKNPKDYEALKDFKNILTSNYANLTRRLEGLGVQASTRHEITNMLGSAINNWDSNPQMALRQIDRLNHQLELVGNKIEEQAHPVNPMGKKFGPEKIASLSDYLPPPKDLTKLKEWFASVPKEVGQAYINGHK